MGIIAYKSETETIIWIVVCNKSSLIDVISDVFFKYDQKYLGDFNLCDFIF